MTLYLENVGIINKALVNLTGLSVIAGKNGTGKSTIGKTIYTIIKAVKEKDKIIKETRKKSAEILGMRIFFTLQNDVNNNDISSNIFINDIKATEPSESMYSDLLHTYTSSIQNANHDFINKYKSNTDNDLLYNYFSLNVFAFKLIDLIDKDQLTEAQDFVASRLNLIPKFSDDINPKTKDLVSSLLQTLLDQIKSTDFENDISSALTYMYDRVFKRQINSLISHQTSTIIFDNFLSYSVSNNADVLPFAKRLSIDKVNENIKSTIFQNATLIETPLILQLQQNEDTENIPIYWVDLIEKVQQGVKSNNPLLESTLREIYKDVDELLGGHLEFDGDEQKMVFVKNEFNKGKLFVNNMSSGEKMLAILQSFVKSGLLGPEHLLILDEPENHLHPEWQIALALILTKLAGAGYPILVNSHSPDFIQALRFFSSSDKNILNKTKFYLANEQEHTIEDKTDKVYEILDELSAPINNIFKQMLKSRSNKPS